jgi:hypothetical protein
MALVKCEECSREISSDAKSCPGCGVKPKKAVGKVGYVVAGLVLLIIFNIAGREAPMEAALTPEQKAAKAAEDAMRKTRFNNTGIAVTRVKSALRDPKSVEWIDVSSSEKGEVVCLTYRARNGFGGMNVEHATATMADYKISSSSDAWNKNCVGKELYDTKKVLAVID